MRSVPGAPMRGTAPLTRVLCPEAGCGAHMTTLDPGIRIAMRGTPKTGTLMGSCPGCSKSYSIPTVKE